MNRSLIPLLVGLALLTGCVSPHQRTARHHASSVVQFLYPNQNPLITPGVPVLKLPLRVGIAFVPPGQPRKNFGSSGESPLSEAKKQELMKTVAADFKSLPFVGAIELIPTTYLRPEGGFENLDQLQSMFGLDVIVLLGADQTQTSRTNQKQIAYLTIVGLFFVEAESNETHTLLDATVYDITNRKLLFRAPGTSIVKGTSAALQTNSELMRDAQRGYDAATTELAKNLRTELESFKTRLKEAPEEIRVEHRPGYTGGGSLDALFALGFVSALTFLARRVRPPVQPDFSA